jgi:hypothetical protein
MFLSILSCVLLMFLYPPIFLHLNKTTYSLYILFVIYLGYIITVVDYKCRYVYIHTLNILVAHVGKLSFFV